MKGVLRQQKEADWRLDRYLHSLFWKGNGKGVSTLKDHGTDSNFCLSYVPTLHFSAFRISLINPCLFLLSISLPRKQTHNIDTLKWTTLLSPKGYPVFFQRFCFLLCTVSLVLFSSFLAQGNNAGGYCVACQ